MCIAGIAKSGILKSAQITENLWTLQIVQNVTNTFLRGILSDVVLGIPAPLVNIGSTQTMKS